MTRTRMSRPQVAGGMTGWPEIACQRGHRTHTTEPVTVTLGGETSYADYAPIPERLARTFTMNIWKAKPFGLGYCPAADVVSDTIRTLGVWEVAETIIMLNCFERRPDNLFVDIGAQIGWYSMLAATTGLDVCAIEADPDVARVLGVNLLSVYTNFLIDQRRVGDGFELLHAHDRNLTVKIDIEGAEPHAIEALIPYMEDSKVDYILIEMSPCFHGGYEALTEQIMGYGLRMGVLPDKSDPPAVLRSIDDLTWIDDPAKASAWIVQQEQVNVLFARP